MCAIDFIAIKVSIEFSYVYKIMVPMRWRMSSTFHSRREKIVFSKPKRPRDLSLSGVLVTKEGLRDKSRTKFTTPDLENDLFSPRGVHREHLPSTLPRFHLSQRQHVMIDSVPLQGYLTHKKSPPLWDRPWALGLGLV